MGEGRGSEAAFLADTSLAGAVGVGEGEGEGAGVNEGEGDVGGGSGLGLASDAGSSGAGDMASKIGNGLGDWNVIASLRAMNQYFNC